MIDEDRDAAIGVKAQEPVFLLLIGHDVAIEEREGKRSAKCEYIGVVRKGGGPGEWRTYMREYVHSVP